MAANSVSAMEIRLTEFFDAIDLPAVIVDRIAPHQIEYHNPVFEQVIKDRTDAPGKDDEALRTLIGLNFIDLLQPCLITPSIKVFTEWLDGAHGPAPHQTTLRTRLRLVNTEKTDELASGRKYVDFNWKCNLVKSKYLSIVGNHSAIKSFKSPKNEATYPQQRMGTSILAGDQINQQDEGSDLGSSVASNSAKTPKAASSTSSGHHESSSRGEDSQFADSFTSSEIARESSWTHHPRVRRRFTYNLPV